MQRFGPDKDKGRYTLKPQTPLIVPPEPRRIRTRDHMPQTTKTQAIALITRSPSVDDVFSGSIDLANGEAMHNQILLISNVGGILLAIFQRVTFINSSTVNNMLPQYTSGANVGINESDYQVIGPYLALIKKSALNVIADDEVADQLFVKNNSGGTQTVIVWARLRHILDLSKRDGGGPSI